MKTPALLIALLLTLGASGTAIAGSANPGGTRTVKIGGTGGTLQKQLVGRWALVGIDTGQKQMPIPGNMKLVFELRADGTAAVFTSRRNKAAKNLGRWSVQKNTLLFHTKGKPKPESARYWLKGDSLTLVPPGSRKNMRLHLKRLRSARP